MLLGYLGAMLFVSGLVFFEIARRNMIAVREIKRDIDEHKNQLLAIVTMDQRRRRLR
jgi:hypothetical protein